MSSDEERRNRYQRARDVLFDPGMADGVSTLAGRIPTEARWVGAQRALLRVRLIIVTGTTEVI